MTNCSAHPSAPAGWSCTSCHRALCPDCTGWRVAGYGRIELCMHCGAMARRLRAHRSELTPFRGSLPGSLLWPLSAGGFVSLVTLALFWFLLSLLGGLGAIIGEGLVFAYLFQILRHTAAGHDDVPGPADFQGLFDGIIEPWFRAILASVWFVLPLLIWMDVKGLSPLHMLMQRAPFPSSPAAYLLLFLGALLYPMAIITGALGAPLTTLVNPFAIIGLSFRAGFDYWVCAIFCFLCTLGTGFVGSGTRHLFEIHPISFSGFFIAVLTLYLPFVSFRALGLLVRARGDSVGYGGRDSYRVPVLDAQPLHEVKAPVDARDEQASYTYTPINLNAANERMELTGQERAEVAAPEKNSQPPSVPPELQGWRPRRPSSVKPGALSPVLDLQAVESPAQFAAPAELSPDESPPALAPGHEDLFGSPAEDLTPAEGSAPIRSALELVHTSRSVREPIEVADRAALAESPREPALDSTVANEEFVGTQNISRAPISPAAEAAPSAAENAQAAAASSIAAAAPPRSMVEPAPDELRPTPKTKPGAAKADPWASAAAPDSPGEASALRVPAAFKQPKPASWRISPVVSAQTTSTSTVTAGVTTAVSAPPPAAIASGPSDAAAPQPAAPAGHQLADLVRDAPFSPLASGANSPAAPAPTAAEAASVNSLPGASHAARLNRCMSLHDLEGARAVLREAGAGVPANTLSVQSWNELARALAEDASRAQSEEKRALGQDVAGANSGEKALLAQAAGRARAEEKRALAELALFACRRGVEIAPESPIAPRTWLLAARVCDELLHDRLRSDRLLSELYKRFPETEEGRFAAKRLNVASAATE